MGRFSHYFKDVDDPRTGNAKRHDFHEIVMIAVLSSLCGGQTCVDMADFAANNEEFLRRFMALERGTPSHDTFSRLFRLLDPKPLAAAMAELVADWGKALGKDGKRQIAVDGKALRRSYLRAGETSPLHMVSALLTEAGIVLGQTAVEGKSNEIPAMAALLDLLDIEGALAAADAMHAQRKTAELIIGKGGDYALALKANQGSLHEDAKEWLEDPEAAKEMLSHQHVDGGHGRVETRTATVSHDVGWLQDDHRWPGLQAVGKIEAVREAAGRTTAETRYYIMSRKMAPEELLEAVRSHWAIENRLHWILDVQMREDDLRNRAGHGPANLAAIRRLAAGIVRLADDKLSFRRRLLKAAQVPDYRFELIEKAAGLSTEIEMQ